MEILTKITTPDSKKNYQAIGTIFGRYDSDLKAVIDGDKVYPVTAFNRRAVKWIKRDRSLYFTCYPCPISPESDELGFYLIGAAEEPRNIVVDDFVLKGIFRNFKDKPRFFICRNPGKEIRNPKMKFQCLQVQWLDPDKKPDGKYHQIIARLVNGKLQEVSPIIQATKNAPPMAYSLSNIKRKKEPAHE